MGKKNMDILLGNILGNAAIKPQDRYEEPAAPLPENDAPAPSTKATTKEKSLMTLGDTSPLYAQKPLWTRCKPLPTKKGLLSVPLWNMS